MFHLIRRRTWHRTSIASHRKIYPTSYEKYSIHRRQCSTRSNEVKVQRRSIFSGIQPTGSVHLGNYFGAIRNWIDLQNDEQNDTIFCIVDLHGITLPYITAEMEGNILLMAATLLGCGIDPVKCILYQQSQVQEHTNLCWILSCLTTMARLSRSAQFKDKSAAFNEEAIPTGLFIYPVLQAADVLLYKTTHVPVGEDQVQHIQLAAHLSRVFNNKYGETFPVPSVLINNDLFSRIKSLQDPLKKMSKSDKDPKAKIDILDPPELILKKIKKSITDFTSAVYFDPENRPGVSNLMSIHQAVTGKSFPSIEAEYNNLDTGMYKKVVADDLIEIMSPIRQKTLDLLKNKDYLRQILISGSEKARLIASNTMTDVYKKVGFKP